MNKFFKLIFSRMVIVGFLIFLQALFLIFCIVKLNEYLVYLQAISIIIDILVVLHLINKDEEPGFKITWLILVLLLPIIGGTLYIIFGNNKMSRKFSRKVIPISNKIDQFYSKNYTQDSETLKELQEQNPILYRQSCYLFRTTKMPVYQNTTSTYFSLGEDLLSSVLEELEKAKHFIFLEYFIIQKGKMWDTILDLLVHKVKEGVDVRVMFDDLGCVQLLPNNYHKTLENKGIKCVVFNPFVPVLSVGHNNRDHRKILVIDGKVAYTGGINLADEYINKIEKHGHWKDTGILIKGEAVRNFTLLFLESWNFYRPEDNEFSKFLVDSKISSKDGYYQPFGDSPLDFEYIGETVYLNLINNATHYLYINTPYLIPSYSLLTALKNAAKRGIDIRITVPHIPDKWYVHLMTQSYYLPLLQAGVKIYEYAPGFLHAKSFVCDDQVGVIGSINLDYRSLYHHFECGVWMVNCSSLLSMKEDYLQTLTTCENITEEFCRKIPLYKRMVAEILKVFAPLM